MMELQIITHLHFAILSEFKVQVVRGKSGMQAQGSTDITRRHQKNPTCLAQILLLTTRQYTMYFFSVCWSM